MARKSKITTPANQMPGEGLFLVHGPCCALTGRTTSQLLSYSFIRAPTPFIREEPSFLRLTYGEIDFNKLFLEEHI